MVAEVLYEKERERERVDRNVKYNAPIKIIEIPSYGV